LQGRRTGSAIVRDGLPDGVAARHYAACPAPKILPVNPMFIVKRTATTIMTTMIITITTTTIMLAAVTAMAVIRMAGTATRTLRRISDGRS
jgi:hypothetical protein